ncbi:MAG: Nre family DNA repair protein [Candidatus Micrarchaeia archaeon]
MHTNSTQNRSETSAVRSKSIYQYMKSPQFLKYYYKFKTVSMLDKEEIEGSSPPDLFVGRYGYPHVYIGPLVPPQLGDTTVLGTPEMWADKSIEEIVKYRSLLVRGIYETNVNNVDKGKVEEIMTELAIADKYTYAEVELKKKPDMGLRFDDNSQPFGPSAPLKNLKIDDVSPNRDVEKAYFDTDLHARDAIVELYNKKVIVSKIQKALSAGVLGTHGKRKFVPTRWSITAVDDTISKANLEKVMTYNTIDATTIYESVALDTRWIVLMMPGEWSYELIEAWYPNTTWNRDNPNIQIYSSHEFSKGRKTYAEIGGCYYAARLAVSEHLNRIGKIASVVILRETHPGYIMPVGVWNVREHVRETLKTQPIKFDSIYDALRYIDNKMDISISTWIRNSTILRHHMLQKRLIV